MKTDIRVLVLALGACLASTACSPLAPQPDHSKFFILSPISDSAVAGVSPASVTQSLTIGIGPIEFPDYLRRLEVVTRTSSNELDLSAEKRWGEPLDKNFARVLSENLSQLLNTQQLEQYPWPRRTEVDYQVAVEVLRFETSADGQSQLTARWVIKDGRTGKDLSASETKASAPVGSGETGGSAALSSDLATLSRDIAAGITALKQIPQRTADATTDPWPHQFTAKKE
jgi:uncharacterized lipoprotein YmbA